MNKITKKNSLSLRTRSPGSGSLRSGSLGSGSLKSESLGSGSLRSGSLRSLGAEVHKVPELANLVRRKYLKISLLAENFEQNPRVENTETFYSQVYFILTEKFLYILLTYYVAIGPYYSDMTLSHIAIKRVNG